MRNHSQILDKWARAVMALSALASASGCISSGEATPFSSGQSDNVSMTGKSWQNTMYLEVNPGNPALDASGVSHYGFSLSAGGTDVVLASSLYESTAGRFIGYTRRFTQGVGWHLPGSQFRINSDDLTGDVPGHAGIARSPGDSLLAVFLGGSSAAVSVSYNDGNWGTSEATDLTPLAIDGVFARRDFDIFEHQDYGEAVKTVFDSFGRAFIFYRDQKIPAVVRMLDWTTASGVAQMTSFGNGVADVGYAFDAVSDGEARVCVTYEEVLPNLYISCLNGVTDIPYDVEGPTMVSSGTSEVQGHAIASDGAGSIMAVYYQKVEGAWQLYATKIDDGVPGVPVRVDPGMPPGYESAPQGCDAQGCLSGRAYPRPAIAHVGGGAYVAAWVAVDTTERLSAVFGATYDPVSGWGPVLNVSTALRYLYRPSYHSPRLHGNGKGDAVLGVRVVTYEPSNTQPQLDLYKTTVARYHKSVGFKYVETVGDGCQPTTSQLYAACTQPPEVAVFSDGDALVIYQDMDQNKRFRLESIEFKK